MAFQKINDNLYLNQALVVSCGIIQKGSKNIYTLKLNNGSDINLTDICPNNAIAEEIYNQVKAWEGGGGGSEHVADEIYDTVTKTIVIPAIIEDGETYELPMEYDMSKFILPSGKPEILYGDFQIPPCVLLFAGGIGVIIGENQYSYTNGSEGIGWYVSISGEEPVKLTDPIELTIDRSKIVEGKEEILKLVLGLEPTEETITVDQTMKEKVEDLRNWTYKEETSTEMVYGLATGNSYKINFNVLNYLDLLPYDKTSYETLYSTKDETISYSSVYYDSIRIAFNGNTYYFVFDLRDTTNYGTWRKGSNYSYEAWTEEELEDVTFVYNESNTHTADLTKLILNTDGSIVDSLVDGTTYKVNFNVNAYLDLLENTNVSVSYYRQDYNNCIEHYTSGAWQYCPYAYINSNTYYFIPQIGENYPGYWADSTYKGNIYDEEDLADVQFILDREGIQNETSLRRILTNLDGSPIVEDHEETHTTTTTLEEHLNDIKNWPYEMGTETVEEDLTNGHEYRPKLSINTMEFPFNNASFYEDIENGISINQSTNASGGQIRLYINYSINEIEYTYNAQNNNWSYYDDESYVLITDKNQLPTFVYDSSCVNNTYIDCLKEILDTTSTISKVVTVGDKIDEPVKNKVYESDGLGFFSIPKWSGLDTSLNYPILLYEDVSNNVNARLFYMGNMFGFMVSIDNSTYIIQSATSGGYTENVWTPSKPIIPNYNDSYVNQQYIDIWTHFYGEDSVTVGETIDALDAKTSSLAYTTIIPDSPNTDGRLVVVVCNEEPEYKYSGYLYLIAEDMVIENNESGGNQGGLIDDGGIQIAG